MAGRTKGGSPTAKTRKKSGGKGGSYPVFDQKSCVNAVRLRNHGKSMTASAVLAKASRWANAHNNAACKAAVRKAREVSKKK